MYSPGLEKDVNAKVETCGRCFRRKDPAQTAELVNMKTSRPMELVCTDSLTLEMSNGDYEHTFVISDHFNRCDQAMSRRNRTTQTTTKTLYDNLYRVYSFSGKKNYTVTKAEKSKAMLFGSFADLPVLQRLARTSPYHAQSKQTRTF